MSFLSFFKYVLFIYNFLVMLFGASLLGLAIYFYVDSLQYIEISSRLWPIYSTFFISIIGIGLFTFIVGFFGCCGACKESSCMLCVYFTILIAICGCLAVLIFLPEKLEIKPQLLKQDLQEDVRKIIQRSYRRYNTTSFANMIIDKIQEDFQCCGSSNFTDWQYSLQNNATRPDIGIGTLSSYIVSPQNPIARHPSSLSSQPQQLQQNYYRQQQLQQQQAVTVMTSHRVPVSCCSKYNENSYNSCKEAIAKSDANPYDPYRIPGVNQDGCVDKIHNYLFVVNWWPINIVGGLCIGLQGLSLIFSLCLCCAINRAYDDDYEDDGDEEDGK